MATKTATPKRPSLKTEARNAAKDLRMMLRAIGAYPSKRKPANPGIAEMQADLKEFATQLKLPDLFSVWIITNRLNEWRPSKRWQKQHDAHERAWKKSQAKAGK